MLNREECMAIYDRNNNKRAWLEPMCANDRRLVLRNIDEVLHCWTMSEVDKEEQAQAARLCAGLNQVAGHTFGGLQRTADAALAWLRDGTLPAREG